MTAITETNRLGDVLKFEENNQYSRDEVVVANGQNLLVGMVVALLSANGEIVRLNPAATDGSEVAVGIIGADVDASNGAKKSWIISRHATVSDQGIIWPDIITDEEKATAINQLSQQGIIIRQGA